MTMLHAAALAERYITRHSGTTLTKNAIKTMLRSGCVPSVRAGNRVFYGYEAFEQYLEHGEPVRDMCGKIRRIV